jgi:RHS repeat-associated protein
VKQFDENNVLVSETKAVFNQYGQATKTIQPGSDGADGRTELYTYYSNAPNPTRAECGNKPEWEFLLCFTEYPTTATLPNRHISNYDYRLNATRVDEKNATGIKRTTLSTFLDDNRLYETTIQTPTTASVTTRNVYDPTTLLQTGTQKYSAGTLQSSTQKTYDSFGRQTSYTNSLGETETTTFVPENQFAAGSIQTVTNQQNSTSYVYGSATEPRAMVTGLKIEKTGTNSYLYEYQATYDELGRLTKQTGPNSLYQTFTYTDSNQTASMSYGQTSNNVATNLYTWVRSYDQYGRVLTETEPDAQETSRTNSYSYDSSGRLTSNETTTDTTCNLNSYSYDQAGNRTNQTTGDCNNQTATSHSYNSFSQLTNPGYVYDELGRNTLIPAVDAPNQANGNITLAYNSTDDVTSINQGSTTTTFSYDTETRRLNETNNTVTTTRHYTDSSDNPSWVTQNGSSPKTDIYTPSLGAGLNITTTIQGTTKTADIQLQDLRGNTVTTIDLTTNTATGWSSYDEFGNPHTPTNNTNLINYTTYAKAERATNTTGLILMGARVYNPTTNQFTAPDPINGGNENTFVYPNDPINQEDHAGLCSVGGNSPLTQGPNPFCVNPKPPSPFKPNLQFLKDSLAKYGTSKWPLFKFPEKPVLLGVYDRGFKAFVNDNHFVMLKLKAGQEWTKGLNTQWLSNQIKSGRTILLTNNPKGSWGVGGKPGGGFALELRILEKHGYSFVQINQTFWLAGKK